MARTKAADLRTKSADEIKSRVVELRKEQFNLRVQRATGQLAGTAQTSKVRREIAQLLTIQNQKNNPKAAPKRAAAKK